MSICVDVARKKRVKVYALNADRQWDDKGTGHVTSVVSSQQCVHSNTTNNEQQLSLVVKSESDQSLIIEHKVHTDTPYQRQQGTLIVWAESESLDLALSFQDSDACDEIWRKICAFQGKEPTATISGGCQFQAGASVAAAFHQNQTQNQNQNQHHNHNHHQSSSPPRAPSDLLTVTTPSVNQQQQQIQQLITPSNLVPSSSPSSISSSSSSSSSPGSLSISSSGPTSVAPSTHCVRNRSRVSSSASIKSSAVMSTSMTSAPTSSSNVVTSGGQAATSANSSTNRNSSSTSSSSSSSSNGTNNNNNNNNHHSSSNNNSTNTSKKTKGRVRIKVEFIHNKLRRYTTFSKRKTGLMKKAFELATLTGTQVMLLVASETGHVYTFATRKLQPMIISEAGKALIQTCLNSPDPINSSSSSSSSNNNNSQNHNDNTSTNGTANNNNNNNSANSTVGSTNQQIGAAASPLTPQLINGVEQAQLHLLRGVSPNHSNSNNTNTSNNNNRDQQLYHHQQQQQQQHQHQHNPNGAESNGTSSVNALLGLSQSTANGQQQRGQNSMPNQNQANDQRMSATGFEETELSCNITDVGDLSANDSKVNLMANVTFSGSSTGSNGSPAGSSTANGDHNHNHHHHGLNDMNHHHHHLLVHHQQHHQSQQQQQQQQQQHQQQQQPMQQQLSQHSSHHHQHSHHQHGHSQHTQHSQHGQHANTHVNNGVHYASIGHHLSNALGDNGGGNYMHSNEELLISNAGSLPPFCTL